MNTAYLQLKREMHDELLRILDYWQNNTIDYEHGGFFGKIDFYNTVIPKSSKGIILNTRILRSFSAASNYLKTDTYKEICDRSYEYLKCYFKDTKNIGVFWELDYLGKPINKRKQVYAQSFAIYALCEYYIYSGNQESKDWAIEIFECLESNAKDTVYGGYFEAYKEDWKPISDMRLSDKDMNAAKSMNTHLHILEAYTALLKIYDNAHLREALKMLIEIMNDKILNKKYHYDLFFDQKWNLLSYTISFGHDIESAWLVLKAADIVNDPVLIEKSNRIAVKVADTFLKHGIDVDGSVLNETNLVTNHTDTDRHWWPQVEALIGLKEAHSIENKECYITSSINIWNYTKKYLLDYENGDWHFRVNQEGKPYTEEDKISMWKAPYHTTRACIMINE